MMGLMPAGGWCRRGMSGMRALIAMSGGVDSSVAARMMASQGYDCVGCTMRLYENDVVGMDTLFNLPELSFWQTYGLIWLAHIIFPSNTRWSSSND